VDEWIWDLGLPGANCASPLSNQRKPRWRKMKGLIKIHARKPLIIIPDAPNGEGEAHATANSSLMLMAKYYYAFVCCRLNEYGAVCRGHFFPSFSLESADGKDMREPGLLRS
jgi:hypothetical protein